MAGLRTMEGVMDSRQAEHYTILVDAVQRADPSTVEQHAVLCFEPVFMYRAIGEGRADVVSALLNHGTKNVNVSITPGIGSTPLHLAALGGHCGIVADLISHHADVNRQNDLNQTALHVVCSEGHLNIVRLLLKQGIDVNITDYRNETALVKAAREGHKELIDLFLQYLPASHRVSLKSVLNVITSGRHSPVKMLLRRFASTRFDSESSPVAGTSPGRILCRELGPCWSGVLHAACIRGHKHVVKTLLEHGANVNAIDTTGVTAIGCAAGYGRRSIVSMLLAWGADARRPDAEGETPLLKAAWGGHADIVGMLIHQGLAVNDTDKDGMTPLHFAARKGHLDTVRCLIDLGADVHAMTRGGMAYCLDYPVLSGATPLHMAAWRGHLQVMEAIIRKGADVDAFTFMGRSALHIATDTALYSGEKRKLKSAAQPNTVRNLTASI